ncbi:MAG: glycoside hydrolase family 172 protein, partial [Phycisphaerae bacterium]
MFEKLSPYLFSTLQSRAVSHENPTGGKGIACKDRGNGNCRKGAPAIRNIPPGKTVVLCDIEGPGMIRHLWFARPSDKPEDLRNFIIRIYWDDSPHPSVEAPIGDFFGVAHGRLAHFMTPYLGMPEGRGFQCYFPMPFSRRCRMTFENDTDGVLGMLFYQVDYTLGDQVTPEMGRFHAHFRRQNPCPVSQDYVLLDTQGSPGVFAGAVIGCNPIGPNWWGEGEMKFYIDG